VREQGGQPVHVRPSPRSRFSPDERSDGPSRQPSSRTRRAGPMSGHLRVVVGEDQTLVREGIVRVLERAGVDVVGVAVDAPDLLDSARTHHPDVVIADIRMPPDLEDDGLRAALEIRATMPDIGVVVLSQFLEAQYARELVGERPDGVGYLLKEKVAYPHILVDAVCRVAAGESALDPDVVERLVIRKRVSSPFDDLTPRERDVLALMAQGRSNAGIAGKLVVSVPAVERHVTSIFSKLGLRQSDADQHRRVLAVLRYLQS
jgi:DNA-binding NarL/FixJ family response regulator